LVGLPVTERPSFFLALLPRLLEMRARTGRPHWLVVDESHHLLPASWQPAASTLPPDMDRMLFIPVHPDQGAPAVRGIIATGAAVGGSPEPTGRQFCKAAGERPPALTPVTLQSGEVLVWDRRSGKPPFRVVVAGARAERRRHSRKYAEGELPP